MKLFRLMALLLIGCQWHIANAASPMPVLPQYKMVDLGALQQQSPTMSWVFANGLNQHGVVVGDSTRLPEHTHAARWPAAESQPEVVDDLGAPLGATSSTAPASTFSARPTLASACSRASAPPRMRNAPRNYSANSATRTSSAISAPSARHPPRLSPTRRPSPST